jgi:hypothetical protein
MSVLSCCHKRRSNSQNPQVALHRCQPRPPELRLPACPSAMWPPPCRIASSPRSALRCNPQRTSPIQFPLNPLFGTSQPPGWDPSNPLSPYKIVVQLTTDLERCRVGVCKRTNAQLKDEAGTLGSVSILLACQWGQPLGALMVWKSMRQPA